MPKYRVTFAKVQEHHFEVEVDVPPGPAMREDALARAWAIEEQTPLDQFQPHDWGTTTLYDVERLDPTPSQET